MTTSVMQSTARPFWTNYPSPVATIPLEAIDSFQGGTYQIDLNAVGIETLSRHCGEDHRPSVVTNTKGHLSKEERSNLGDTQKGPLQMTLRQGFEYVINRINHCVATPAPGSPLLRSMCIFDGSMEQNGALFRALTSIDHKDPTGSSPRTGFGYDIYVSWLTLICETLEHEKLIHSWERSVHGTLIIHAKI